MSDRIDSALKELADKEPGFGLASILVALMMARHLEDDHAYSADDAFAYVGIPPSKVERLRSELTELLVRDDV